MYPFLVNDFYKSLSMFDEPPTLYSLMESMVNFNRDPEDKVKIKDLSKYAKTTIFNFDYPTSVDFPKDDFEELFLNHYMFRRINYDTFTSFQIHLQVKLNDIMPKYLKMVEGFKNIQFDGYVETHERSQTDSNSATSNVSSSSSDTSTSDTKYSDAPQGMLDEIASGDYMSEYTLNNGSATGTSTSASSTSNNGTVEETITIKRADSIEEYQKFLQTINNIYSQIFKECDSLFYGLIN